MTEVNASSGGCGGILPQIDEEISIFSDNGLGDFIEF
jgi:hypothetical protein